MEYVVASQEWVPCYGDTLRSIAPFRRIILRRLYIGPDEEVLAEGDWYLPPDDLSGAVSYTIQRQFKLSLLREDVRQGLLEVSRDDIVTKPWRIEWLNQSFEKEQTGERIAVTALGRRWAEVRHGYQRKTWHYWRYCVEMWLAVMMGYITFCIASLAILLSRQPNPSESLLIAMMAGSLLAFGLIAEVGYVMLSWPRRWPTSLEISQLEGWMNKRGYKLVG
jgi:hypothetical protein